MTRDDRRDEPEAHGCGRRPIARRLATCVAVLELPATPRPRAVRAAGCTVNVVEWGVPGRSPLLLLHGGMAHARWWDLVAARLADRLHVFALDMPGHGDSPWLDPARYAHVELSAVRELLATLAPGPWTLGGHSNGGLQSVVVATDDGAGSHGSSRSTFP
jgi:pimeloyl-ACP methyl ester carboxylesterase